MKNINQITQEYMKNNTDGYRKINEFLYRIFNYNINAFEITENEQKQYMDELCNIDLNL